MRRVIICTCSTSEEFSKNKGLHLGKYKIPGDLYVGDRGLLVVTSQEWCDWLTNKTNEVPQDAIKIRSDSDVL